MEKSIKFIVSLLLLACGGGQTQTIDLNDPATSPLRADVVALHKELVSMGLQRVGPVRHRATLPRGRTVGYNLEPTPETPCFAIFALAAKPSDINLVLIDPSGMALKSDLGGASSAWVSVCPTAAGRHLARIQSAGESGEFYFGVYSANAEVDLKPKIAALGVASGKHEVQTKTERVAADTETQQRIAAVDRRLAPRSFRQVIEPIGYALGEGQETRLKLALVGGECYAFAAIGSHGVVDTDLYLETAIGAPVMSDAEPRGSDSVVEFCPIQNAQFVLRAVDYRGTGQLFVAVWQKRTAAVAPEDQHLVTSAESSQTLEQRFGAYDAEMQQRGYEVLDKSVLRGRLMTSSPVAAMNVRLKPESCYAFFAVADNGIRTLHLHVEDRDGDVIDLDEEHHTRPTVRVCVHGRDEHRVVLRAAEGEGAFHVASYRWPRGTQGPFELRDVMYVRFAETSHVLSRDSYAPDFGHDPVRGSLRANRKTTKKVKVPSGCHALLAVGDASIRDLNLSVSARRKVIARDDTKSGFPVARFCVERPTSVDVALRSARSGAFLLQLFSEQSD